MARNISGSAKIGGQVVPDLSTVSKARSRPGLSYVTEDRKVLGLILDEPILRNISLANLMGISKNGVLNKRGREAQVAEDYRGAMSIRTPGVPAKGA